MHVVEYVVTCNLFYNL